jgi:hypothetical protein
MQIQLKHKRIPSKETHTQARRRIPISVAAAERDKLKQFPASNFNLHRAPEARRRLRSTFVLTLHLHG